MSASRPVLLLKSLPKKFANQPGYYLHNGHWHAAHKDVPKGAPMAAHPHAAGEHQPAKHFSDEEWAQLHLPDTNSNAPTFNKQLKGLKEMSEAGHVTGIVGSGYGVNTYGKKLATIANKLLGMHGSHHTVTPGQKAGEHHAVQGAPAAAPAEPAGEKTLAQQLTDDFHDALNIADDYVSKHGKSAETYTAIAEAMKQAGHPEFAGQYAYLAEKFAEPAAAAPAPAGGTGGELNGVPAYDYIGHNMHGVAVADLAKEWIGDNPGAWDELNEALTAHKHPELATYSAENPSGEPEAKAPAPAPAPTPAPEPAKPKLTIPTFVEGKFGKNAVKWYEKVAQQVIDLAEAGDAAGLEALKADGLKPNPKTNKVGATWQGKTQNSSALLSLHAKALEQAKGGEKPAADEPFMPNGWKSAVDGAVSENGATELQELVDHAKKQGYSHTMIAYAERGLAKVQSQAPAPTPAPEAAPAPVAPPPPPPANSAKQELLGQLDAAGMVVTDHPKGVLLSTSPNGYPKTYANQTQASNAAQKLADAGFDAEVIGSYPYMVKVHKKLPVALHTPAVAAAGGSKVTQIPWADQYLPSGVNAASHNKKVDAIKNAAEAGDVAALEAMKFGVNTYGKKQAKLAALAIAALKEDHAAEGHGHAQPGMEPSQPAAPIKEAKAAPPEYPSIDASSVFSTGAQNVKAALAAGDMAPVIDEFKKTVDMDSTNGKKLHAYAKAALVHLGMPAEAIEALAKGDAPAQPAIKKLVSNADIEAIGKSMPTGIPNNGYTKAATKDAQAGNVDGVKSAYYTVDDGYPKTKTYIKKLLAVMGVPESELAELDGPKDGDTKPGANGGTLVFKDGHWHLQGEAAAGVLDATMKATLNTLAASGDPSSLKMAMKYNAPGSPIHEYAKKLLARIEQSQGAAPAAAPAAPVHPVDALGMPDLSTLLPGGQKSVLVGLHKLKEQIKAGDHSGLKGAHKFMSATQKHIFALPHPSMDGMKYKYKGASESNKHIAAYLEDLKLIAAGKKAKGGYKTHDPAHAQELLDHAAKAYGWTTTPSAPTASPGAGFTAAAPAPAAKPGVESIDGWAKQSGTQGGYTDGAVFTDPAGQQWYCKFQTAGEVGAKAEVLALKLYEAAGCDVPEMKVISHGGKVGTASKIIAGLTTNKGALQAGSEHSIFSGYAADAWLANWDTVGNNPAAGKGFDNIQFAGGKAYRIDAGGALMFKGTGAKKSAAEWADDVVELKTLKDAGVNPNTAKAFKHMTEADIKASVAKVLAIPDWKISELVKEFGPGSEAEKIALTSKLVKRQQSMAAQYPDAKKKADASAKGPKVEKSKPDPTSLKVDPSLLPKPHDFMNWGGSGKPISDKPYVQHNAKAEQDILAFALKGNLVALKEYKFTPVDKLTGLPTGEGPKPIAEHSSAHVKQFYDDCVGFLETLANPPEPLRLFDGKDANSVAELSAHFKPFDFGKGVGNVPANQRLGFWIALGHATDPKKFAPKAVGKSMSEAVKKKAYSMFQKLPQTVKTFISNVQGSGSANQPYRDGKEKDTSGQDTRQVVADLYANGTEHDEGMSIYKWINMPDSMVKQLLAEPEGLVFQNPGSMCTSKHPTATSGFGEHRVTIHFAKGAKGIDTFGSGGFAGEQEITTIPGVRFMVLSRAMVPGKHGAKNRLELEVLMLPPDPTYLANLNRTPTVN